MWAVMMAALAATPISFESAVARADESVDVQHAGTAVERQRAELEHLGAMTSNPSFLLQPGLRTEQGTTRPEGQLTLQQSVNLAGLGTARRAALARDVEVAQWSLLGLQRARRVAVAEAWLAAWAAAEAIRAAQEEEALAIQLAQRTKRATSSGGLTLVESASARAFAAEARAFRLGLEGEAVDAGGRLAMLLGVPDLLEVDGDPPTLTAVVPPAPEAGVRGPTVRQLEAQVESERAKEAEVAAQWASALQLQLQGGHDAPNQWFANVGVGLTVPVFEHGQRDRAGHRAVAHRLEGEAALARVVAQVEVKLLAHELEHTQEVFTAVHDEQWPAAAEAARLQLRRFEVGEATLQELLLVRRQALSARVEAIRARAALLAARVHAREMLRSLAGGAP